MEVDFKRKPRAYIIAMGAIILHYIAPEQRRRGGERARARFFVFTQILYGSDKHT
jgi:hypothetical protein